MIFCGGVHTPAIRVLDRYQCCRCGHFVRVVSGLEDETGVRRKTARRNR